MSFEPGKPVAEFSGRVECRRAAGPLGLTLIGRAADRPEETLYAGFVTKPSDGLPDVLDDVRVHSQGRQRYRISSSRGAWDISATGLHLHRDVTAEFYKAVPPRVAPLRKRLFWRAVLALAATPLGRRLLARRKR